jgi:hypothetical protein
MHQTVPDRRGARTPGEEIVYRPFGFRGAGWLDHVEPFADLGPVDRDQMQAM